MLIKYSEVFLGIKYRIVNATGSYDGGPMYFLPRAFKVKWIAVVICILLSIYGVEVFMFKTVVSSISKNFSIAPTAVMIVLLVAIFFVGFGGVKRVGQISSILVPVFVLAYLFFGIWIIADNLELLPGVIKSVFVSAFTGHAAVGAFIGSTVSQAISQGLASGCYTGDIGIGYASVIHAETREKNLVRQSSLAIAAIFLDTIIVCSLTLLVILITGVWQENIEASFMVQEALSRYFPHMNYFMSFLIFLLGYSTIIAYFVVGLKCCKFLSKRFGAWIFSIYALLAFVSTMFFEIQQAFTIMLLAGGGLMVINLLGIFLLRKEVSFTFPIDEKR
jgi:AGCS family alanine or glycine:cation symporter